MTFQFKANYFGLKAIKPATSDIPPGAEIEVLIEIEIGNAASVQAKESLVYPYTIQTAFKCNVDTYFFKVPIQMNHLLEVRGELTKSDFKQCYTNCRIARVFNAITSPPQCKNIDSFSKLLRENNLFVVQKKRSDDNTTLYISCRAANNKLSYISLDFVEDQMEAEVRSEDSEILELLYQSILFLANN